MDNRETSTPDTRKRKRARVPVENRQRATIACASCRRLKEKCDGSVPCQRCQRFKRHCFAVPSGSVEANPLRDGRTPSAERVQDLEFIARHFLGIGRLSDAQLRRVVLDLETGSSKLDTPPRSHDADELTLDQELFTVKTVSSCVHHYSGELSHWNFSQRVREQATKRLKDATPISVPENPILEYWRANHLQSRGSAIPRLMNSLPPKHVALFLARVYFKYAQTNTFFADEGWVLTKISTLYGMGENLRGNDAAWICTTLGVLAVGTEFVHMEEARTHIMSLGDSGGDCATAAAAGESFYKLAAELIPDVITIASVESVQAFLLLAHYALPLDTAGLAYTYLGLALKMAVQNGMHRKYRGDLDIETVDLRNRLWWTTYRLEKRISILHGRPTSISSNEIDAEYPSDKAPQRQARFLENATTKITDWLGDIAVIIHMLRRSPKRLRHAYFKRMMQVRQHYMEWWQGAKLPAPITDSRAVAHIHMSHHLNLIFLGRPFMFQSQGAGTFTDGESPLRNMIAELVRDAVISAECIVNTASHLHMGPGLARASYVEFSSCRAAILVLLAQCLDEPSVELRAKLTQGMKLIKHMAPANASTKSEASVMTAIEAAIKQLDSRAELLSNNEPAASHENFSSFMEWASGLQNEGSQSQLPALVADDGTSMTSAQTSDIKETLFGWSPLDVSIFDGEPGGSVGLDSYHFEDAFSIATTGAELFGSTDWQQ